MPPATGTSMRSGSGLTGAPYRSRPHPPGPVPDAAVKTAGRPDDQPSMRLRLAPRPARPLPRRLQRRGRAAGRAGRHHAVRAAAGRGGDPGGDRPARAPAVARDRLPAPRHAAQAGLRALAAVRAGEGPALAHGRRRAAPRAARAPHRPGRARPPARHLRPGARRRRAAAGRARRGAAGGRRVRRRARREPEADGRPLRARVPDAAPQRRVLALGRAARARPAPSSSARDPAVFQYYPGRGMQLQQLASWGRVNARLGACIEPRRRTQRDLVSAIGARVHHGPCARRRLRRELDRLVELGARRDRFVAWEYYFSFGGGTPPWISGMTQGTAIQALARGARVFPKCRAATGAPRCARSAPSARRRRSGCAWPRPAAATTSCTPSRPACGSSTATCRRSPGCATWRRSAAAAPRACSTAAASAPRAAPSAGFDTGAWSLYSQSGRESTLGYHQLVGGFLGNLCRRTDVRTYCSAQRRFARYEREPPRIHLARLAPPARGARHGAALLALQARLRARARHERRGRDGGAQHGRPARHLHRAVDAAAPRPLPRAHPGQGPERPARRARRHRPRPDERARPAAARRAAARGRAAGREARARRRGVRPSKPGISPLRKASTKRR